ncbi:MAG TPA: SPW repeat protein [Opitutaceae bacterium]|nr:SPW repeat protein [Opitutaceae bacterium]
MNESEKQQTISWASGINLIAGIWLFISTWAVSSAASSSRSNDIIFGIIVFVLSWIRLANRSRSGAASWLNVLAGIWLIIAPFALHFETAGQTWNSVIVGIIVAILGIVSGGAGASTHHPAATA